MTDTKVTASDLTRMLERHYVPDGKPWTGLFAAEIESPCGTRRADAIWLPLTIAGGTLLVGHEIKVSRSDLMVELRDPSKAEPWSQYCDTWYLVVSDPLFLVGLEIPEAWGVMALKTIEDAPDDAPIDPPSGQIAVYITPDRDYAKWYAARGNGDLYEVRPSGELKPSSEDHIESFMVESAEVVRVLERGVRLDRSDRRALSRKWRKADLRKARMLFQGLALSRDLKNEG